MKKTIETLLERAQQLEAETREMGLPTLGALPEFINELKTLIAQRDCCHNTDASYPFKTHGAEGMVWKCSKCKKIIDIETSD